MNIFLAIYFLSDEVKRMSYMEHTVRAGKVINSNIYFVWIFEENSLLVKSAGRYENPIKRNLKMDMA